MNQYQWQSTEAEGEITAVEDTEELLSNAVIFYYDEAKRFDGSPFTKE